MATPLTEAVRIATELLNRDFDEIGKGNKAILSRAEAAAIARLVADAQITLNALLEGEPMNRGRRPL